MAHGERMEKGDESRNNTTDMSIVLSDDEVEQLEKFRKPKCEAGCCNDKHNPAGVGYCVLSHIPSMMGWRCAGCPPALGYQDREERGDRPRKGRDKAQNERGR